MRRQKLLLPFLLAPFALLAQKIDNTASWRDMQSESYFRFHYDNDFFSSSDFNYTQGYNFEIVLKSLERNPINLLLLKSKTGVKRYGLSIEHIGFTPKKYELAEIQYNERPFASAIMLKNFVVSIDTVSKSRIVSSMNFGLIGPGAFGKEMQAGIHEATGNKVPLGWRNQIKNDIVLNYNIDYEKQVLRVQDLFSVQANASIKAGSLFSNASVGVTAVAGLINNPYQTKKAKRKFALYAYSQPIATAVLYDATLQGGLFNRKSPYTLKTSQIERLTAQHTYGIVLQTKTLYFEYSRAALTREFTAQRASKWGGFRVGFTF
ncbi:MAG: lipid A deacylase LpxR family protein [Flavobacterium sp.]|nr:MAG: lipid A deacylase LpxR family protein [Flavobacterium sp.]